MEARKITIVSTANQSKKVIMSAATTLAELKADLRENNIDYDGMTFYEGTSKTELKMDNSILPHDVPYKGTTTNELVFMLTNTNKKIRSGAMSRIEIYNAIKANNLQAECIKRFGKNFTMCKTSDLISLLEEKSNKKPVAVTTVTKESSKKTNKEIATNGECVDKVARAAITNLVVMLESNGTIEDYEKDSILDILGGSTFVEIGDSKVSESPYSDAELDEMLREMK